MCSPLYQRYLAFLSLSTNRIYTCFKLSLSVTVDMEAQSSFSVHHPNSSDRQLGNCWKQKALQIGSLRTNSHFSDNTEQCVWEGWDGNKQNSLMAFLSWHGLCSSKSFFPNFTAWLLFLPHYAVSRENGLCECRRREITVLDSAPSRRSGPEARRSQSNKYTHTNRLVKRRWKITEKIDIGSELNAFAFYRVETVSFIHEGRAAAVERENESRSATQGKRNEMKMRRFSLGIMKRWQKKEPIEKEKNLFNTLYFFNPITFQRILNN